MAGRGPGTRLQPGEETVPVLIKFPSSQLAEIDASRGEAPRAEWIREACAMRAALDNDSPAQ
jgi:hypothetical protein